MHRTNITRRTLLAGGVGLAALAGTACATGGQTSSSSNGGVAGAAKAASLRSFDMHADTIDVLAMVGHTPYSKFNDKFSGTLASTNAQVSADRMGDVGWVQCYSIWVPDTEGDDKGDIPAIDWYHEAVKWFKGQMDQLGDRFTQVRSFSQIPSVLDEGKVAAILTVENGACVDQDLKVVDEFAEDGVLIAGITWNFKNAMGAGNQYPDVALTDLGVKYLESLEDHGIVADVSHINEKGFWAVDRYATKPFVATHSNARAVCGHLRNLTDDQFAAIAARGGVVGLNFNESFVRDGGNAYTFDDLAAHVQHWLQVGGEDIIALGSDRDGAVVPTWIADCSSQESLFARFEERFGDDVARKLFFDNAMRFFGSL